MAITQPPLPGRESARQSSRNLARIWALRVVVLPQIPEQVAHKYAA